MQHEQLVSSLEFGSGTEWIEQLISIHQKNREDAQDPFKKRLYKLKLIKFFRIFQNPHNLILERFVCLGFNFIENCI